MTSRFITACCLEAIVRQTKKMKKRVPKGTSEYQAAWILDSDGEWESGDEEEEGSEEENMEEDFEPKEEELSQVSLARRKLSYFIINLKDQKEVILLCLNFYV